MKQVWTAQTLGSGQQKLVAKLKRSKMALRSWNKNVFGQIDHHISTLEEKLASLEDSLKANDCVHTKQEFLAVKNELELWKKCEDIRIGQIAKKKWLKEGDQNSKFFHAFINAY